MSSDKILVLARPAFLVAFLIPAIGLAQTSTWIAPASGSQAWADPTNWSDGVPNSLSAIAVFPTSPPSGGNFAIISGTDITLAALDLPRGEVQVGGVDRAGPAGALQAATLTISGAGVSPAGDHGRLSVPNGTLRFAAASVFQGDILATVYNTFFNARSAVIFADSSVDRGHILVGAGRGNGSLEFRDASILDGGEIAMNSFLGGSLVVFRDQSSVRDGLVRTVSSIDCATIRIQDAANTAGLAIVGTNSIAGMIRIDATEATGPVAIKSISGNVDIAMGNNPLRVGGDLSLASGSQLSLTSPATANVSVGGTASLDGALNLGALPVAAQVGSHRYPVVAASRIVSRFTTTNGLPSSTAMLKAALEYTATDVAVRLQQQSFAGLAAANSPASTALGVHLDETLATAQAGYFDLLAGLNRMTATDDVRTALAALTPDRYAELPDQAFVQSAARHAGIERQLDAPNSVFFSARHTRRERDANGEHPRSVASSDGGIAGAVWRGSTWTLATSVARDEETVQLDEVGSRSSNRSITPGLHGRWSAGPVHLDATIAFTQHEYSLRRRITYSGFDALAVAHPTAKQWDFSLTAARDFRSPRGQLTVEVGALESTWRAGDFSESAAGNAGMHFADWRNRSLRLLAGLNLAPAPSRSKWSPHLAIRWLHELDRDRSVPSHFASGDTDYYLAPGRPAEADELQADVGVYWQATRHVGISIAANLATSGQRSASTGLSGACRWQF
ncbi:MAG: autotransporter domain-containing protein [Opitutae bacterium]|nr:autotransporter domain-containing protein [Opitutae bacterium]